MTNLSEDAQEGDIRDLFSHFGYIKRIFLAKDKITQHSKVDYDPTINDENYYAYNNLFL